MSPSCVILLVEDDPNDAFFVARSLSELGFTGRLERLPDSQKARAYLEGSGSYADREKFPMPNMVICDSSLPARGSGVELLEWIRQQSATVSMPFIILSGEVAPEVTRRAEAAGVQKILLKGSNYKDLNASLREAVRELPPNCRKWLKE